MGKKLLNLLIALTLVFVFIVFISYVGQNKKDDVYIQKGSAFVIEKNTFTVDITVANGTEQPSKPFKVKLKINNSLLSAALGFYEYDLVESDRSKSPFTIEPHKEMVIRKSFPLNSIIDYSSVGDEVDNSSNTPSVEVEVITETYTKGFTLDKF